MLAAAYLIYQHHPFAVLITAAQVFLMIAVHDNPFIFKGTELDGNDDHYWGMSFNMYRQMFILLITAYTCKGAGNQKEEGKEE